MNVDEIGTYLEHLGLNDVEIDDFFEHHGVKGQRWGVRRQKRPMTPTEAKYKLEKQSIKNEYKLNKKDIKVGQKNEQAKRRLIVGAGVVATGLVAYGGYKYLKMKPSDIESGARHITQVIHVGGETVLNELTV
jgi:hypothetical protein